MALLFWLHFWVKLSLSVEQLCRGLYFVFSDWFLNLMIEVLFCSISAGNQTQIGKVLIGNDNRYRLFFILCDYSNQGRTNSPGYICRKSNPGPFNRESNVFTTRSEWLF